MFRHWQHLVKVRERLWSVLMRKNSAVSSDMRFLIDIYLHYNPLLTLTEVLLLLKPNRRQESGHDCWILVSRRCTLNAWHPPHCDSSRAHKYSVLFAYGIIVSEYNPGSIYVWMQHYYENSLLIYKHHFQETGLNISIIYKARD